MSADLPALARWTTAGCLAVLAGVVHLVLAPQHVAESAPLGVAFLVAAVGLIVSGLRLIATPTVLARSRVAAVTLAVAGAYAASRATPLLGHLHSGLDLLGITTTTVEIAAAWMVSAGARRGRVRHGLAAAAMVLSGVVAVPQLATAAEDEPSGCLAPTRAIQLWAYELPRAADDRIRLGWGTRPDDPTSASIPGPLIELMEGECITVTVTNDVSAETLTELRSAYPTGHDAPLGVSLHVHGVKYTSASDGTAHTGSYVPPGESRTYTWYAAPRVVTAGRVTSMGSAGYWWYHDHVAGTTHGTGGLDAGLFGGVVVRRPTDVAPDRSFTTVFGPRMSVLCGSTSITATGAIETPSDPCLTARQGERVEIVAFGVGHDFHTFHLHGHNWASNRTGILTGVDDETPLIDARTLGPSESFGFQVVAGEAVGPGSWMLHCHVQAHSDAGMVAFLDVVPAGADLSSATPHSH